MQQQEWHLSTTHNSAFTFGEEQSAAAGSSHAQTQCGQVGVPLAGGANVRADAMQRTHTRSRRRCSNHSSSNSSSSSSNNSSISYSSMSSTAHSCRGISSNNSGIPGESPGNGVQATTDTTLEPSSPMPSFSQAVPLLPCLPSPNCIALAPAQQLPQQRPLQQQQQQQQQQVQSQDLQGSTFYNVCHERKSSGRTRSTRAASQKRVCCDPVVGGGEQMKQWPYVLYIAMDAVPGLCVGVCVCVWRWVWLVTMVTMGGDLQPGSLADRLLTGLGQPQLNP